MAILVQLYWIDGDPSNGFHGFDNCKVLEVLGL